MKYSVYVILALSLIVFVASFVYLVSVAGHKKIRNRCREVFFAKYRPICLLSYF